MTTVQQIITIAVIAVTTALTRALAFILFPPGKQTPPFVKYLGQVLPLAVFGMLVVYCLKDIDWLAGSHGIPELLGIAATVLLHLWKRNMLWSIAGGTIIYMLLIRLVFV